MYARESSPTRLIISFGIESTHVEEEGERPHIRVPYARQLHGTPLKMLKKNWSGQSLIRFMGS